MIFNCMHQNIDPKPVNSHSANEACNQCFIAIAIHFWKGGKASCCRKELNNIIRKDNWLFLLISYIKIHKELTLVTMVVCREIKKHDGKQGDQYENLQWCFESVYILDMWDRVKKERKSKNVPWLSHMCLHSSKRKIFCLNQRKVFRFSMVKYTFKVLGYLYIPFA